MAERWKNNNSNKPEPDKTDTGILIIAKCAQTPAGTVVGQDWRIDPNTKPDHHAAKQLRMASQLLNF